MFLKNLETLGEKQKNNNNNNDNNNNKIEKENSLEL